MGISALISAIIGIVTGALPDLLKELRDTRDAAREAKFLELRHRLEIERLEKQASMKIQEVTLQAEAAESAATAQIMQSIQAAQTAAMQSVAGQGYAWIEALNAVLRPATCAILLAVFVMVVLGLSDAVPKEIFAPMYVESFWAVMAYLFGYRPLRKGAVNA